jgi:shikimate kinase
MQTECSDLSAYKIPVAYKIPEDKCISIIGMAAAGKSTLSRELARLLGWVAVDSDNLIEAAYGAKLQTIVDALSKEEFYDVEAAVIGRIRMQRCVIATGGSVVYRPEAVEHLLTLGPIIHISAPLDIIMERIARKPDRGLVIAPGQTIEELFDERCKLYEQYATLQVQGGEAPSEHYAQVTLELLEAYFEKLGSLKGHYCTPPNTSI